MSNTENPYEAQARERKATAIADALAQGWILMDWPSRAVHGTASAWAEAITSEELRTRWADVARQRPPSDATWARVVELLKRWEAPRTLAFLN